MLVMALLAGCGSEPIGRCVEGRSIPGTAQVASISSPPPPGELACANDPVQVLLDFTPASSADASFAASGVPLLLPPGKHPPRAWVEASGLAVSSSHPARYVQHGPCPPTLELTDLDYAAGEAACP